MFAVIKTDVHILNATESGNEDGQGLVEYSLILAFIAAVAILAVTFLGTDLSSALSSIGNAL
ncbi:MAG: Flp family type IVb pilin [Solirubrobacteraceae bacterium]